MVNWIHVLVMMSTTLACWRKMENGMQWQPPIKQQCENTDTCHETDRSIAPMHILVPALFPSMISFLKTFPYLFNSSKYRLGILCQASLIYLCSITFLCICVAVYMKISKTQAYALALHLSITVLSKMNVQGRNLDQHGISAATVWFQLVPSFLLCAGATYVGPPVPILDTPWIMSTCSVRSHLLGWAASSTLGQWALSSIDMILRT